MGLTEDKKQLGANTCQNIDANLSFNNSYTMTSSFKQMREKKFIAVYKYNIFMSFLFLTNSKHFFNKKC